MPNFYGTGTEPITLAGQRITAELHEAVTGSEWRETIEGAPSLSLTVTDNREQVHRLNRALSGTVRGQLYTLVSIAKNSFNSYQLELESDTSVRLRRKGGAIAASEVMSSRRTQLKRRGWTVESRDGEDWLVGPGGRRSVDRDKQSRRQFIAALAKGAGGGIKVQGEEYRRKSRKELTTGDDDWWEAAQAVAGEVGRRVFVRRNRLWFASDWWLLQRTPFATVTADDDAVDEITWTVDVGQPVADLTIQARSTTLHAGDTIRVDGEGPADGLWIVSEVAGTLHRPDVTISCIQPSPTLPEPEEEFDEGEVGGDVELSFGLDASGIPGGASTRVRAFLNSLYKARGKPYVWGGVSLSSGADCSGLIVAALRDMGVNSPRFTSATVSSYGRTVSVAQGLRTPGAVLRKSGHVAVSIGGGRTFEASSRSRPIGNLNANGRGWTSAILLRAIF